MDPPFLTETGKADEESKFYFYEKIKNEAPSSFQSNPMPSHPEDFNILEKIRQMRELTKDGVLRVNKNILQHPNSLISVIHDSIIKSQVSTFKICGQISKDNRVDEMVINGFLGLNVCESKAKSNLNINGSHLRQALRVSSHFYYPKITQPCMSKSSRNIERKQQLELLTNDINEKIGPAKPPRGQNERLKISTSLNDDELFYRYNKLGWICVYCSNFNFECKQPIIVL